MWEQPPQHQPTPDLHRYHPPPPTYDHRQQYHPQFLPPPPPPQNYPNFNPNIHPPPPQPPPDFRHLTPPSLLPPHHLSVPNYGSPSPVHDHVNFRVSWPEHHRSFNSNDFRFSGRHRDVSEPHLGFNRGLVRHEAGDYTRQRFSTGMNIDRDMPGSDFCRSSVHGGGYVRRTASPMDFQGDTVHRGWSVKTQQYEDVPRSFSGVRYGEFERCNEVRRSDGNIEDLRGKVRRKSALLRIVDNAAHNSFTCKNKKKKFSVLGSSSKTSPFKVKYSSPAKHRIKKEGENLLRENTPVHVSFKSNSLVAKQIVAPSSPVDITNSSVTPRSRRFSKLAATGVDDITTSLNEVNQSRMMLQKSSLSPPNTSHPGKNIELTEGSDCSGVKRNLFDICTSPVGQIDRHDKVFSLDNCNSSSGKGSAKCHKKQKLSEDRLPLYMQPIDEQSEAARSFSPAKITGCKDFTENYCLLPTSLDTRSLVNIVDDHSGHLLSQHIDEATTESSMKHCGSQQSNYRESPLSNEFCCKETVNVTAVAKVNDIDRSKHPQDKCIHISSLKADLLCNTISDQTCPEGIVEKGILEEPTVTMTVDNNIKVDQDVVLRSNYTKKRKERNAQSDVLDSIPAVSVNENDLFNKATIDSDKGYCSIPDSVGLEKEVTCVMDNGLVPIDFSYTNCDIKEISSEEVAAHSACNDLISLAPVSSRSMVLNNSSPAPAQVSSESASGIKIAMPTLKTCSEPDVPSTLVSLEGMPEWKATNINTRSEHKATDVVLGNNKKEVGYSIDRTNLHRPIQVGTLSSVSRDVNYLKSNCATSGRSKYQKSYALHAPRTPSLCFASPKVESSKVHPMKSRTWHRSDSDSAVPLSNKTSGSNSVPPHSHTLNSGKFQRNSYIRKGHTLLRSSSPVIAVSRSPQVPTDLAPQATSLCIEDNKGNSENKDDLTIGLNRRGSSEDLLNIQNNEPCKSLEKTSLGVSDNCPAESPDNSLMGLVGSSESISTPMRSPASAGLVQHQDEVKVKETTENQSMLINSLGTQDSVNNKGSCGSSKSDYNLLSKHDSCQLIFASPPSHLAAEKAQNNQIPSSDSYIKRRVNQIIRTPSDSAQALPVSSCSLNKEGILAQNMVNKSSASKLHKGTMHNSSYSSLVWTLHGTPPTSKLTEGHCQRKRSNNWIDARDSKASLNSRASSMLRKLSSFRNQKTLYKRSTHGLSVRKYKVVAMGGCSLKWSKSIEKRSKKANEDATRAVVAAESLKRFQSRPQNSMFREATKRHTSSKSARCVMPRPRGHVFRIGSVRRMDPSRKTLPSILDDGSANGDLEDKDSKTVYVPSKSAIGKNQYIRIGNGNQLVMDPKKRIRMLANEKIRWSLHNVRQRSTKKRRFCQFYTRFGKCNKDDGKCPYIHDSSKIAVCTKFLKGICSDLNCKLTHKVIPERMEDCSYFLQGMCSNESCPYRHVNVNPNATTCEGFLRGYCVDGDECAKKHSYVCHVYEATGSCPEESKCKLHHPKKHKAKNIGSRFSKGRYFGHPAPEVSDPQAVVPLKISSLKSSSTFKDEEIPEFISLDDDVNVIEEISCLSKHDDDDMEIEVFDLNALIKPIRIMYKDTGPEHRKPGNSGIMDEVSPH